MATLMAKDDEGHFVEPYKIIDEIFFEGIAFGRLEQRMADKEQEIVWTIRTARQNRIYSMAEIFGYTVHKSQEDVFGAIYRFNRINEDFIQ